MEEAIITLTNASYKVIEFFPEADPLKHRSKDRALSIMDAIIHLKGTDGWASLQKEKIKADVLQDIDVLIGYFWLAKSQGWLSPMNYFIISQEYEKLKKGLHKQPEFTKKIPFGLQMPEPKLPDANMSVNNQQLIEKAETPAELSERQAKILDFLKTNKQAQVMDLEKILNGVTKRTIRRDLDDLLGSGKIVRKGEFNQVSYEIQAGRTG